MNSLPLIAALICLWNAPIYADIADNGKTITLRIS